MCQATVFVVEDDQQREIMREVIRLTVVEGGVQLESFFDEPLVVPARVESIDFLKHSVKLVPFESRGA